MFRALVSYGVSFLFVCFVAAGFQGLMGFRALGFRAGVRVWRDDSCDWAAFCGLCRVFEKLSQASNKITML